MWPATGTPALATLTSGLCAATAALLIQLEVLVEMMSIGERPKKFSPQMSPRCPFNHILLHDRVSYSHLAV